MTEIRQRQLTPMVRVVNCNNVDTPIPQVWGFLDARTFLDRSRRADHTLGPNSDPTPLELLELTGAFICQTPFSFAEDRPVQYARGGVPTMQKVPSRAIATPVVVCVYRGVGQAERALSACDPDSGGDAIVVG